MCSRSKALTTTPRPSPKYPNTNNDLGPGRRPTWTMGQIIYTTPLGRSRNFRSQSSQPELPEIPESSTTLHCQSSQSSHTPPRAKSLSNKKNGPVYTSTGRNFNNNLGFLFTFWKWYTPMWPLRKLPEARETGVYPFGRSKGLPELPELPKAPKISQSSQKKRTPELRNLVRCII